VNVPFYQIIKGIQIL